MLSEDKPAYHAAGQEPPAGDIAGLCVSGGPSSHNGKPGISGGSICPPSQRCAWQWSYLPLKKQHQLAIKPSRLLHVPSYLAEEHMDLKRCVKEGFELQVEADGVLDKHLWPVTLSVYTNTAGYTYYRIGGTRRFAARFQGWVMHAWYCASPTRLLLILSSARHARKSKAPSSEAKQPADVQPPAQPEQRRAAGSVMRYVDVPPPECSMLSTAAPASSASYPQASTGVLVNRTAGLHAGAAGQVVNYGWVSGPADALVEAVAGPVCRDAAQACVIQGTTKLGTASSSAVTLPPGDQHRQPAEHHTCQVATGAGPAPWAPDMSHPAAAQLAGAQMKRVTGLELYVSADGQLVPHPPASPVTASTVMNNQTPSCIVPEYQGCSSVSMLWGTAQPITHHHQQQHTMHTAAEQMCATTQPHLAGDLAHPPSFRSVYQQQTPSLIWVMQQQPHHVTVPQLLPDQHAGAGAAHQHVKLNPIGVAPQGRYSSFQITYQS